MGCIHLPAVFLIPIILIRILILITPFLKLKKTIYSLFSFSYFWAYYLRSVEQKIIYNNNQKRIRRSGSLWIRRSGSLSEKLMMWSMIETKLANDFGPRKLGRHQEQKKNIFGTSKKMLRPCLEVIMLAFFNNIYLQKKFSKLPSLYCFFYLFVQYTIQDTCCYLDKYFLCPRK